MEKLFDLAVTPKTDDTKELYFKKEDGFISYGTYYNSIPLGKLKKYTGIKNLVFSSKGDISLYTEKGFLTDDNEISLDDTPDAHILYVKLKGDTPLPVSVYAKGEYRKIKPCFDICTFKREKQVTENINYLTENMDKDTGIVVVDNAKTLPADSFTDSRVHIIPNENTGGSGGFGKGMRYVAKQEGFTHIILMDDDVSIDIVAVNKLVGFLSFLKPEYEDISVAGSMLNMNRPTIQFEAGGYFSPEGNQTGYGHELDLSKADSLVENEIKKNINYAAWWFLCMPVKYIRAGEFSMPYFIKYDDVEYSLRCKLRLITLNGVGVWHESFEGKYNTNQVYFDVRNYLFLMKKHSPVYSEKWAYNTAHRFIIEKLFRQQYNMAKAVIMAYEDFLKGEEYLTKIDYKEKLAVLKSLSYTMLSDAELKNQYNMEFQEALYKKTTSKTFKRYMQFILYGHLLPPVFLGYGITDVLGDRKEQYTFVKQMLHYNVNDRMGYVTKRNISLFIKLYKEFKGLKPGNI